MVEVIPMVFEGIWTLFGIDRFKLTQRTAISQEIEDPKSFKPQEAGGVK